MPCAVLAHETDFDGWRREARALLARRIPPGDVVWATGARDDLFGGADGPLPPALDPPLSVPRPFIALAQTVTLHRDPQRFALLYRVLSRLRDEPRLLSVAVDADIGRLAAMAKAVRRDIHKMRAFVRFRRTMIDAAEWYVAWFEPEHHIAAANAPFFVRRFATMRWSILTPEASMHWDGMHLAAGPGGRRADAPADDALEDLWRGYYASIFNPARLKVEAMRAEMPVRYWRNLPEAMLIKPLIADAQRRAERMVATGPREANARPQRPRAGG